MKTTGSRLLALVLFVALAPLAGAQEPPYEVPIDDDGVQRVAIVGGSYFFEPARIVAKAGRPLELSVRMERGVVPHRFVLEGVGGVPVADVELAETPKTVRVELPAGTYDFHCPNQLLFFKSHRARGMAGVLELRD